MLEVTNISRPEDGNRAIRKAIDKAHFARASALGQTIKVADIIDNTSTVAARDPAYAVGYLAEKRAVLEVLTKATPGLLARARAIVGGGR